MRCERQTDNIDGNIIVSPFYRM